MVKEIRFEECRDSPLDHGNFAKGFMFLPGILLLPERAGTIANTERSVFMALASFMNSCLFTPKRRKASFPR